VLFWVVVVTVAKCRPLVHALHTTSTCPLKEYTMPTICRGHTVAGTFVMKSFQAKSVRWDCEGVDTEGTWSYSRSDGWVYGHGTFCLVACKHRILGVFKWMRNSANEAKWMWLEKGKLKGLITTVLMDSKADDKDLVFERHRQRGMLLLTTSRKGADKSPAR
jgi:hypothetical protein